MKIRAVIYAIAMAATASVPAFGGGPGMAPYEYEPEPPHFLHRLRPAGGWNPDGRGIFHWWDRDCFPRWCGPDDYCRKPFPNVCRPPLGPVQPATAVPPSR